MSYHSIFHITRYEIRMLLRDWGIRVIVLLFTVGIALLHLFTHSDLSRPQWVTISTSSAIPFTNACLVGYLLSFITIFWAGRFMQKSLDADSSIQVHPFSNTDYLLGKTLGFLVVAFSVTCFWMVMAAFIHLVFCDSPFAIFPYFFYLLTLTLPLLLFVTGLTVWLKGVFRSTALLFVVLPGLFFLLFVYGGRFFYGVADVSASRLPNLFSDIMGFSALDIYLWQRAIFFFGGCGLLLLGVLRMKRLPNRSRLRQGGVCAGLFLLLIGCLAAGKYIGYFSREANARAEIRQVFMEYNDAPKIRITNHDLIFRQSGDSCEVTGKLTLYNPSEQPISSVVLYLNPSLAVASLTAAGHPVDFKRRLQVVVLDYPLEPQQSAVIDFRYHGMLMSAVCYAEIDSLQEATELRNQHIYRPGREFFYLTPEFTLLTPECLWYMVALPPVDVRLPYTTQHSYTRFRLTVVGEKERLPISQGERSVRGDSVRFIPEQQLPGMSLCIGNYVRKAFKASEIASEEQIPDSTLYEIYLFKGHEWLIDGFKEPLKILERWHWYLQPGLQEYHYSKLALIETPLHFCAPARIWKSGSEYVQPEMIFRPEREAFSQIPFKIREFKPKDENIQSEPPHLSTFTGYLNTNFAEMRYRNISFPFVKFNRKHLQVIKNEHELSSLLCPYSCIVSSPEFTGINLLFQAMQFSANSAREGFRDAYSPVNTIEYLGNHCLTDIFGGDAASGTVPEIVYFAGSTLLKHLLTVIPYEEWSKFNREFLAKYAFQEVSYETYARELREATGADILPLTRQYYHPRPLPVFLVGKPRLQRTESADGDIGYLLSLPVWNKGESDGVISFAGNCLHTNLHYLIPAGACQEFRHYFKEERPEFDLEVQTNLAQNIPAYYSFDEVPLDNAPTNLQPGVYEADRKQFLPPAGEYIVDDRDTGFHVVAPGSKLKKKVMKGESRWEYAYDNDAHGDAVKGYFFRKNGEGNTRVEWNTYLDDSGMYELFVFNNGSRFQADGYITMNNMEHHPPVQIYSFSHNEGEEKITLEMQTGINDWVSLGVYFFEAGPAKVSLSDLGVDIYHSVVADAVKWVREK